MRVLYVTTIAPTMGFFPSHIQMLQEAGHTVELACNTDEPLKDRVLALGCKVHHIPFSRSPFSRENLQAYRKFRHIIEAGQYDIVHTHTPNASAIVRLAARDLRAHGTKVFYTAHGFHFYTGAPLKNWLLYYPVEWICSHWTDVQVTINQEDYQRAKKKLHAKRTVYIPGVGIDLDSFGRGNDWKDGEQERNAERQKLGIKDDDILLINVGELSHRKNQEVLLRALAKLHNPKVKLIICGEGNYRKRYENLISELDLSQSVQLLGQRSDVSKLYVCSDIFVFPSYQEGLSVALQEAMACGLPAVCSAIRGNVDLIEDGKGGFLHRPDDVDAIVCGIDKLSNNPMLRQKMGERNKGEVKQYGTEVLLPEIAEIYGVKLSENYHN